MWSTASPTPTPLEHPLLDTRRLRPPAAEDGRPRKYIRSPSTPAYGAKQRIRPGENPKCPATKGRPIFHREDDRRQHLRLLQRRHSPRRKLKTRLQDRRHRSRRRRAPASLWGRCTETGHDPFVRARKPSRDSSTLRAPYAFSRKAGCKYRYHGTFQNVPEPSTKSDALFSLVERKRRFALIGCLGCHCNCQPRRFR